MWGREPCPSNPFEGPESIQTSEQHAELIEGFGLKRGDSVTAQVNDPFEPEISIVLHAIGADGSYVRDINGRIYVKERIKHNASKRNRK